MYHGYINCFICANLSEDQPDSFQSYHNTSDVFSSAWMYLCLSVHHIAHLKVYHPSDGAKTLHGGLHLCLVVTATVQCKVGCRRND